MVKCKGNKKSKRKTLSKKYNIQKRVTNHNKKVRRNAKKAVKAGLMNKRVKKDPGIPNNWPFKKELVAQIERQKADQIAEKEAHREAQRKQKQKMKALLKNAQASQKDFEKREKKVEKQAMEAKSMDAECSRKSFYKELRKVVDMADVVLQVLDARDPNGCRSKRLEADVLSQGKRLVFILNKIDLVPRESVTAWLEFLRKTSPTIAFKATRSTGHVAQAQASATNATEGLLRSSSAALGADTLMSLMKNYARSGDRKTAICVGIVGFPNVGKSSVINSLKRSAACKAGATPGVTRCLQEVQLDKLVKLVDSPGVVLAGKSEDCSVVIRAATKVELLKDPISVVGQLLKRCPKETMMRQYTLPKFTDTHDFLALMAKQRGKLRKGGALNLEAAAISVLSDLATGKFRHYCMPPAEKADKEAAVVSEFAQEINIKDLLRGDDAEIKHLPGRGDADICMESGDIVEDEDDEEMEGSDEEDSDAESGSEEEEEDEEEESAEEEEAPMLVDLSHLKTSEQKKVKNQKSIKAVSSNKKFDKKANRQMGGKKAKKSDDFDFAADMQL